MFLKSFATVISTNELSQPLPRSFFSQEESFLLCCWSKKDTVCPTSYCCDMFFIIGRARTSLYLAVLESICINMKKRNCVAEGVHFHPRTPLVTFSIGKRH